MLQSVGHVCLLGEVKGHRSAPNNLGNTVLLHVLKELDKLCSYHLCHHSAHKGFIRFGIGCSQSSMFWVVMRTHRPNALPTLHIKEPLALPAGRNSGLRGLSLCI